MVDELNHVNNVISKMLDTDSMEDTEASNHFLNCSGFLVLLEDYKKIYIRALQIVSLSRVYEDNVDGEPFSPDQSIVKDMLRSIRNISKYMDADVKIAKATRKDGSDCPSIEQMEEARGLSGSLTI